MRLAEFKQARERTGEIEMSVTGRTSGHEIAILVWFVEKSAKVSLFPVSVHSARISCIIYLAWVSHRTCLPAGTFSGLPFSHNLARH